MTSAMAAAWSTNAVIRDAFRNSFALFMLAAVAVLGLWMVVDYALILPSEQSFQQGQSQRPERSPLKNDTEEILRLLERRVEQ